MKACHLGGIFLAKVQKISIKIDVLDVKKDQYRT